MQKAYSDFKRDLLSGIRSGRFKQNFEDNKGNMKSAWRLEHEIVRQFDTDPLLHEG